MVPTRHGAVRLVSPSETGDGHLASCLVGDLLVAAGSMVAEGRPDSTGPVVRIESRVRSFRGVGGARSDWRRWPGVYTFCIAASHIARPDRLVLSLQAHLAPGTSLRLPEMERRSRPDLA